MPLQPIADMMRRAREGRYAIGYFESWDIASLQGTLDAAEEAKAPVIVGFNGEFLSRRERVASERLEWYGALGRAAAESAKVPCGFIFNECPDHAWVRRAIGCGFNLVMPVPAEEGSDYAKDTAAIVKEAHAHGVAVEAELGELPWGVPGEEHHGHGAGEGTDPQVAVKFVRDTGIDLLAVSVGNVHVLVEGKRGLDLHRLGALAKAVSVPLVLHGGTGIDDDSLRQAISLGVTKVNYGTGLKQAYLSAVRRALGNPDANPHNLLGYGGDRDVLMAGRAAVRTAVLERMGHLHCAGKG